MSEDILTSLVDLGEARFAELLWRAKLDPSLVPGEKAPLRDRAIAALRLWGQRDLPEGELAEAIRSCAYAYGVERRDRALVVDLHSTQAQSLPISEDGRAGTRPVEAIIRFPSRHDGALDAALRAVPLDKETWRWALVGLEQAVGAALDGLVGRLHVYMQAPHPLALAVARMADQISRGSSVVYHQFDAVGRRWIELSPRTATEPGRGVFSAVRAVESPSDLEGSLLSIEAPHPTSDETLLRAAADAGVGRIYRLPGVTPGERVSLKLPGDEALVLKGMQDAIAHLRRVHPGEPIHLLTSMPIGVFALLGTSLAPTALEEVIVHSYDAKAARYVPVVSVAERKPRLVEAL